MHSSGKHSVLAPQAEVAELQRRLDAAVGEKDKLDQQVVALRTAEEAAEHVQEQLDTLLHNKLQLQEALMAAEADNATLAADLSASNEELEQVKYRLLVLPVLQGKPQ
jgi:predicted nuclease with TOPRIM domain